MPKIGFGVSFFAKFMALIMPVIVIQLLFSWTTSKAAMGRQNMFELPSSPEAIPPAHYLSGEKDFDLQKHFGEYRRVLPYDLYRDFVAIYLNTDLPIVNKLRVLDHMFIKLPDELLHRLPIPWAFRQLPFEIQKRIRKVYYSKRFTFDEKMQILNEVLAEMPDENRSQVRMKPLLPSAKSPAIVEPLPKSSPQNSKLVGEELIPVSGEQHRPPPVESLPPVKPVPVAEPLPQEGRGEAENGGGGGLPFAIDFDVPVVLRFNGRLETDALRGYLEPADFRLLQRIVSGQSGLSQKTRARLVGLLLKDAYARNPDAFPLELSPEHLLRNKPFTDLDARRELDQIRSMGARLMFGVNPVDRADPLHTLFSLIKHQDGGASEVDEQQQQQPLEENGKNSGWEEPGINQNGGFKILKEEEVNEPTEYSRCEQWCERQHKKLNSGRPPTENGYEKVESPRPFSSIKSNNDNNKVHETTATLAELLHRPAPPLDVMGMPVGLKTVDFFPFDEKAPSRTPAAMSNPEPFSEIPPSLESKYSHLPFPGTVVERRGRHQPPPPPLDTVNKAASDNHKSKQNIGADSPPHLPSPPASSIEVDDRGLCGFISAFKGAIQTQTND